MLFLAHCLIPNQQFVCTVLACVVCLPEDRMVTNSSSTIALGSYFVLEERLYTVKLRHPMWLKADGHGTLRAALKAATVSAFAQPTCGGWSARTKAHLLGFGCLYYSFIWLQFLVSLPTFIKIFDYIASSGPVALGAVTVCDSEHIKRSSHPL